MTWDGGVICCVGTCGGDPVSKDPFLGRAHNADVGSADTWQVEWVSFYVLDLLPHVPPIPIILHDLA